MSVNKKKDYNKMLSAFEDSLLRQLVITPEEQARLDTIHTDPCPRCNGPMTVGMFECAGLCFDCVDKAYALYEKQQESDDPPG